MSGLNKVKHTTLLHVAVGVFVTGAMGLYLAQKYMQNRVRKLPHYREALTIISEHEKAKNALGPPIQVGAVDLADRRRNYLDKDTAMLRVPVTGRIDAGFVDIYAMRASPSEEYRTSKIKLLLNNGSVVIFDNGRWPASATLESD